jgi:hypothetical protein
MNTEGRLLKRLLITHKYKVTPLEVECLRSGNFGFSKYTIFTVQVKKIKIIDQCRKKERKVGNILKENFEVGRGEKVSNFIGTDLDYCVVKINKLGNMSLICFIKGAVA